MKQWCIDNALDVYNREAFFLFGFVLLFEGASCSELGLECQVSAQL